MMSTYFGAPPRRKSRSRSSSASPHHPLKSCLRKDKTTKSESAPMAPQSQSANTPLSAQLQYEPRDNSPVRTHADAVLVQQPVRSKSVQFNGDDGERQFMKISNYLVTQYNKGKCSDNISAKRMLHHYLPTYQDRKEFYRSLSRNFSVLPMFPEPDEHISFSMTRCIHRVFGPVLKSEMNGSIREYSHPAALEKSNKSVMYQPAEATTYGLPRDRTIVDAFFTDQSPPLDMDGHAMFPPPTEHPINHHFFPASPRDASNARSPMVSPRDALSSMVTPRASNEGHRPKKLTIQTSAPTSNSLPNTPLYATGLNGAMLQPDNSLLPAAPPNEYNVPTPPASSSLQISTSTVKSPPPPQPLPFFGKSPTASMGTPSHDPMKPDDKSILESASLSMKLTDLGIQTNKQSLPDDNDLGSIKSNSAKSTNENKQTKRSPSPKFSQYQRLNSKEMLPPIISREELLYFPPSAIPPSSPCCFSNTPSPRKRRQKRPQSYLQIYVKCDWSEPFVQPDRKNDIITWYTNGDNKVTADRTLVVRGTTNLYDLVQGLLFSFGLIDSIDTSPPSGNTDDLLSSLGCYKGVCFLSDVKTTICPETSTTKLTPMPIPGFYYKYVARETINSDSPEHTGSTVLSNDPVGLQRTLTAQVLDTPIFAGSNYENERPSQGRTRLAFVYCAPKRPAYLSSRTQRAIIPETIYHFQILLEGIVDEEDLPSSFMTQVPIRCVSGTGGVHGGSVVDSPGEIAQLNRELWGDRDVVGLVSPSSNRDRNCERIIDVLSTPLFDPLGNQSLKEGVVERCLYDICSGHLSMRIAERTQGTVDACNGTTDWFARQVDMLAKSVSRKTNRCLDEDLLCLGTEYDQKLEALVTKVML